MTESGARGTQYQVVLSGELMPGHDTDQALLLLSSILDAAPSVMRNIFDGVDRRIEQPLSADDALNLQGRLQQAGIKAHVERMPGPDMRLTLRETPASSQVTPIPSAPPMPSSVQRAVQSPPSKPAVPARPAAPSTVASPQAATKPRPGPGHAEASWREAWADSHVDDEPDEDDRLATFVGPSAPNYIRRFERVRLNRRPNMRPSWNWGAVISPFLWALYRKLWLWAMVIGMVEIVIPALLFILARHGVIPASFAQLAVFSVVANRVFWPMVADYLYYRHSHFSLVRLFRLSPGYASELDIANMGGVNRSAVLVGLAFSGVFTLFVWSLVSSVTHSGVDPFEARVSALSRQQDLTNVHTPGEVIEDNKRTQEEENRWGTTRRKLRELGQIVTTWVRSNPSGRNPSQFNLFSLREDTGINADKLQDGWGNEVQMLSDSEGYRLISSGPDQLFGTADDIMYRQVLSQ